MHIFILTRGYPAPGRLYNHAFVHSRVLAYRALGHTVSVCWLRSNQQVEAYEFEGVAVSVGPADHCLKLLLEAAPDAVAAHAIADDFDPVIRAIPLEIPVNGWIYGSEIMAFFRVTERAEDDAGRERKARETFERRLAYWKRLVSDWPPNLRIVFVSHHAADEAFENVGAELPRWTVCPTPIDTNLFADPGKAADDRFNILSIRPFSDWRYANDLSVEAVRIMQDDPLFDRFRFRFVGEGRLFDSVLSPIRHLPNVSCDEGFLTIAQVAEAHRENGVFLIPSRDDAQGVSRDQAMSSGLVAISNRAGAVPEFLDDESGYLCPPEDAECLARSMLELARDPDMFLTKSAAAARRIRQTISMDAIIPREIELLQG